MVESNMKRRKAEQTNNGGGSGSDNGTDMMSSLPDSVLCHILSFLPTRTSVATMTLVSRRYLHLWENLHVFNFNGVFKNLEKFKKFEFFVNSVLTLRKSRDIRKLDIDCDDFMSSEIFETDCVRIWIRAATGPHLQELSLNISYAFGVKIVNLPRCFLTNCTNLVCLSLLIKVEVKHSSVHFPSLKKLYLSTCNVDSEVSFLSGCPRLETLNISFWEGNYLTKVFTQSPSSSKRLKSTNDNFTWTYFEINEIFITLGVIGNIHSMVEAFIGVFSPSETGFVDPILNLLRDDKDDEYVFSRHSTLKCPLHAPVLNYPEFEYLHYLKFILPCFNSNLLVNVLEKCHMLQVLIIQSSKEEAPPLRTWQPESTPVFECLKSHLTYIHIEGYQGFEDELTFAEYILRNGLVLETVLIFVDTSIDLANKYCSVKRLTDIPKGSHMCQLKFDASVSS